MLEEAENENGRRQLLAKIGQLSGEQVITIPGTNYVAANVVRKTDSDRIILHFVNYNTPLKNVRVSVNLDGVLKQIDNKRIKVLSPDGGAKAIEVLSVRGAKVEFVLPELDVTSVRHCVRQTPHPQFRLACSCCRNLELRSK
jgi:hypothetical protein